MATTMLTLAEAQRAVDVVLGDGFSVEVVGGTIVVTPAAGWSHNAVAAELLVWLRSRVPAGLAEVAEVDISADPTGAGEGPR